MIQDDLIFTLADVQLVRKVSVNIDDFDLYAREAQANYLQKLLGDKLYTVMLGDLSAGVPQGTRFKELIDGVIYTDGRDIIFRGVKLYAIYVWLHLYMANADLSITPLGAQLFKDEQAERNEAASAMRNAKAHFISAADGLEEPILRFLEFKGSVYPEFSESFKIEQADADNITFQVFGRKFEAPDNFLTS